jgi:hypothetical protein
MAGPVGCFTLAAGAKNFCKSDHFHAVFTLPGRAVTRLHRSPGDTPFFAIGFKMSWKEKAWSLVLASAVALVAQPPAAAAQAQPQPPLNQAITAPDVKLRRERLEEQKKPRHEVKVDPGIIDRYVGYYQLNPYQVFAVERRDDNLFIRLTGEDALQLYPESEQKFFYKDITAQISFGTDPQGRATGLVLHQGGLEKPAPRIDQAQAETIAEAFAKRIKDETPMPGSEAALRHQLGAFANGQPAYADMTDDLATVTKPQIPAISRRFALYGPLQSLAFLGIGMTGWDLYEAKFANGVAICRILLTPDGKVSGLRLEWGP